MKRILAFLLLVALTPAWSMSTKERASIGENRVEARKAARQHQKIVNKAARKQHKAIKKYQKARRRAIKDSQRQQRQNSLRNRSH